MLSHILCQRVSEEILYAPQKRRDRVRGTASSSITFVYSSYDRKVKMDINIDLMMPAKVMAKDIFLGEVFVYNDIVLIRIQKGTLCANLRKDGLIAGVSLNNGGVVVIKDSEMVVPANGIVTLTPR